jgi:hypothetical protein
LRTIVLAWLRRDRSRRVELHIKDGDGEQSVIFSADRMDNEAFDRIAESIRQRIAGS